MANQTAAVDVCIILSYDQGRDLFGLRAPQLYAGGEYNLVSGKAEPGEDAVAAMMREAHEEVGVRLTREDLHPFGVVHTAGSDGPRVGFVFGATYRPERHGAVRNAEPAKCDGLVWADPRQPPQPLESYNAAALRHVSGEAGPVILHGWPA